MTATQQLRQPLTRRAIRALRRLNGELALGFDLRSGAR
jgi:hypothetical protein